MCEVKFTYKKSMDIYNTDYFIINKKFLMSIGLWPYQDYKKKLFIRIALTIVMFFIFLPQMLRMYLYFGVDMDILIEHTAAFVYLLGIYLKFLTSIVFEKKLKILYENIAQNWETIKDEDEKMILIKYSSRGRTLTIGYIVYMAAALLSFTTLPITPMVLNFLKPLNESRPKIFILGGEFFVDRLEHYGKIYLFDCVCCSITAIIICAVDSMYAVCIEHCLGLFAIINFTDIIASSYSSSFLILMGLNMIILSFESVLILIKLNNIIEVVRFGFILLGIVIHLFYISWPGQKLIDFSVGLFQDAYVNEWYESSIKAQKLLGFMTLRCIRPCQITAGGIYVINFSNFASIVKTSLSYMTLFASLR